MLDSILHLCNAALGKHIFIATLLDKLPFFAFIKDILQNNYEIQIALLRDSIAKDSLNLAKKSYIGDLTISGSYMYL